VKALRKFPQFDHVAIPPLKGGAKDIYILNFSNLAPPLERWNDYTIIYNSFHMN
jgi:hypothetical protein